jgi:hypothetical protein
MEVVSATKEMASERIGKAFEMGMAELLNFWKKELLKSLSSREKNVSK